MNRSFLRHQWSAPPVVAWSMVFRLLLGTQKLEHAPPFLLLLKKKKKEKSKICKYPSKKTNIINSFPIKTMMWLLKTSSAASHLVRVRVDVDVRLYQQHVVDLVLPPRRPRRGDVVNLFLYINIYRYIYIFSQNHRAQLASEKIITSHSVRGGVAVIVMTGMMMVAGTTTMWRGERRSTAHAHK